MKQVVLFLSLGALMACGGGGKRPAPAVAAFDTTGMGNSWRRLDLPVLDDNVRHDTLLIHTTYALGHGLFLMAARNKEDTRDGLRLYLYRPKADSSADVIASSSPGYDSYTLLPTFFAGADTADGFFILANEGEKQSWGQKLFWLKGRRFTDMGFLDVALRGWQTRDDSTYQWRTSIAMNAAITKVGPDEFQVRFTGDSLQLYDDLRGGSEVMFPSSAIMYDCRPGKCVLYVRGEAVLPKEGA